MSHRTEQALRKILQARQMIVLASFTGVLRVDNHCDHDHA